MTAVRLQRPPVTVPRQWLLRPHRLLRLAPVGMATAAAAGQRGNAEHSRGGTRSPEKRRRRGKHEKPQKVPAPGCRQRGAPLGPMGQRRPCPWQWSQQNPPPRTGALRFEKAPIRQGGPG